MCERLSTETRKARKLHRCFSCGTLIRPGETYSIYGMTDGGTAWSIKEHIECSLDANGADGLYESGACTDRTLAEWAFESGVPLDQLGLRPQTVARLQSVREASDNWHTAIYRDFLESHYPEHRWADDGGPA